jgi:hypothetical protein
MTRTASAPGARSPQTEQSRPPPGLLDVSGRLSQLRGSFGKGPGERRESRSRQPKPRSLRSLSCPHCGPVRRGRGQRRRQGAAPAEVRTGRSPAPPGSIRCSHSSLVSAYSTQPCSAPSTGSVPSQAKVRASVMPHFSITRREARLTAIVWAVIRSMPSSGKPLSISACDPSVASPCPRSAAVAGSRDR